MVRSEVINFVDNLIKKYPVVGFTKSASSFGIKAKALIEKILSDKKEVLQWVNIENREDVQEIQDYFQELTGARTVPRIFIGGKFYGGGDDVEVGFRTGDLKNKLREAGVLNQNDVVKAKDFVEGTIKKYPIVGFGIAYYPANIKAKAYLEFLVGKNQDKLHWVDILSTEGPLNNYQEISDYLTSLTGERTIPTVFIGGKLFGGYEKVESAFQNGSLRLKLEEVGALELKVSPETKTYIDDLIKKYPVIGFSKSFCPFCIKGKALVEHFVPRFKPNAYKWIEIENQENTKEIQDYLYQLTGGRSVPRVFIGGKSIGGGDDIEKLAIQKELEPKLKEAGALVD